MWWAKSQHNAMDWVNVMLVLAIKIILPSVDIPYLDSFRSII